MAEKRSLLVRNASIPDDLMQETFLQVWRQPTACDPRRGGVRADLLGIVRKKAADWWRRNKTGTIAAVESPLSCAAGTSKLGRDHFQTKWKRLPTGRCCPDYRRRSATAGMGASRCASGLGF